MTEHLKLSVDGGVAQILLDRADKMNAFTFQMIDAWADALQTCQADDAIRVVIITGVGNAFCSGGDIDEMETQLGLSPEQRRHDIASRVQRIPRILQDFDKPIIAAVNGVAAGAGMDLALHCDLRYAANSARFAETYIRMGLVPGAGGAHFLPRLIGESRALEMFLTGEFINAEEAWRIGLVNKVFADEQLMPEVYKIADELQHRPSLTVSLLKRAIKQSLRNDLSTNLDLISSHFGVISSTAAHQDAVKAFLARRKIE